MEWWMDTIALYSLGAGFSWRGIFRSVWKSKPSGSLYRQDWADIFGLAVGTTLLSLLWPIVRPIVALNVKNDNAARTLGDLIASTKQERKDEKKKQMQTRIAELERELELD